MIAVKLTLGQSDEIIVLSIQIKRRNNMIEGLFNKATVIANMLHKF